jgi:hypothetical protein
MKGSKKDRELKEMLAKNERLSLGVPSDAIIFTYGKFERIRIRI